MCNLYEEDDLELDEFRDIMVKLVKSDFSPDIRAMKLKEMVKFNGKKVAVNKVHLKLNLERTVIIHFLI
jgi:hypothetical protein